MTEKKEMNEQAKAFQAEFVELLTKYEVGVYGSMHFRIGDDTLVLHAIDEEATDAEQPDVNEDE